MGWAARHAQGLHVGKAFEHTVEVGHVAEYHPFINRLEEVRAGMQRLQAIEAAGHLQPGVAAVEERQEEHIAFSFWQAGHGVVNLIE